MLFTTARAGASFEAIEASAEAREPIDRIELVANGWIVATSVAPGDAKRLSALAGKWDAHEDAAYFVQWIDELIRQTLDDKTRFESDAQRDEALANNREAREVYSAAANK